MLCFKKLQSIINNMLAGDASAKRAEESVFSAFQDRYAPIFERQTSQLSDSLKNKGIPIGSEAYARAMETNAQNQNDAILAAANQATLTGQQRADQTLANNASIFSLFNPLNSYQPGAGTPNIDISARTAVLITVHASTRTKPTSLPLISLATPLQILKATMLINF